MKQEHEKVQKECSNYKEKQYKQHIEYTNKIDEK